MNTRDRITEALHKGFVDSNIRIEEEKRSKFLTNDPKSKTTVLDSLKHELSNSNSFIFSVAFITESGLNELKTILMDLKLKGIRGKLITSNYLAFNSPKVYRELLKIENLEVRISNKEGFHSKGYIFEHTDYTTLILGSSNLTSHALKINHEWNLKISSTYDGEIINSVKKTIDQMWSESTILTEEWVLLYELNYVKPNYTDMMVNNIVQEEKSDEIIPNKMQIEALLGIEEIREQNEKKALLVSATGTGKTYLSAFDVKNYQPKRFLFIVHREQIINDAIKSFQRVIGNDISEYGVLSGNRKDFDKKYIFSTIQTLSLDHNLEQFNEKDFDYILIDEVHKSGADSYSKVLAYFKPEFLLGMTATPERMDGINIFEIFDYNLAYEISIQEAIEESLICPFHYFGVTDYVKDGVVIDNTTSLKELVSEERIKHLIDKIEYYGHSGDKVKGLIFTKDRKEARIVSEMMNKYNYKTSYLTSKNKLEERYCEINKLESGELDYLITVDIFNEGIDIPSVNQIVMMRETQSSIVFIQQLGRGLRNHEDKDFVTIIDYIGNYKNNFMIPLALSGDTSYNSINLRKIHSENKYISGISSVNFEEIASQRIFDSLSKNSVSSKRFLKKEYFRVRNNIGEIPLLMDFYENKSIDPVIIEETYKSMYDFIMYYDKESYIKKFGEVLTDDMKKFIRMITKMFVNGKRLHEIILLEILMSDKNISISDLEDTYISKGIDFSKNTIRSVISMFDYTYYHSTDRKNYPTIDLINVDNDVVSISSDLNKLFENNTFRRFVNDVILATYKKSEQYDMGSTFKVGELYSREDASRLLNWKTDSKGTIYGYLTKDNESVIFVKYDKSNIDETFDYGDSFVNNEVMKWSSKHSLTLETMDKKLRDILYSEKIGNRCRLFVQTTDEVYGEMHYYLGEVTPIKGSSHNSKMKNGRDVVIMNLKLETPISDELLKYITLSTEENL